MKNLLIHAACLMILCLGTGCATVRSDELAASIESIGDWGRGNAAATAQAEQAVRSAPAPVASAK